MRNSHPISEYLDTVFARLDGLNAPEDFARIVLRWEAFSLIMDRLDEANESKDRDILFPLLEDMISMIDYDELEDRMYLWFNETMDEVGGYHDVIGD